MVTGASVSTGALVLGRFLRPNGGGRATDFVALSFITPPLRGVPYTGAFSFAFDGCGGGFARPGAEPAPEPLVTAMPARQICASRVSQIQEVAKPQPCVGHRPQEGYSPQTGGFEAAYEEATYRKP